MATANDDQDEGGSESAVDRIEHEIDETRADLEARVGELAARRRAATDLSGQLRRHPWAFAVTGAALIAGTTGALIWHRRRARRANALPSRVVASARAALSSLKTGKTPERGRGGEMSARAIATRILLAAATAATSALARRALRRLGRSKDERA